MVLWCSGLTTAQLHSIKFERKFCISSNSDRGVSRFAMVRPSTMIPTGNKAERFSLVNNFVKTMLHHYHYHRQIKAH